MGTDTPIEVGDRVEPIPPVDAIGIVLELLPGLVDGDAARVQWIHGKGLVGRATLTAVKALRKLPS